MLLVDRNLLPCHDHSTQCQLMLAWIFVVSYSRVRLCQGCVSVQLGVLIAHIETFALSWCKAFAFFAAFCFLCAFLSAAKVMMLSAWRAEAFWGRVGHWCGWGGERQSMLSKCPGQGVPVDAPSTQRAQGCARLERSVLSNSFTITNWNPRQ